MFGAKRRLIVPIATIDWKTATEYWELNDTTVSLVFQPFVSTKGLEGKIWI